MREILFRAKKEYGNTWAYGNITQSTKGRAYIVEPEYSGHMRVNPDTICQYIGIVDKNGNKVFEGDILKTQYGRLCRVEYKAGSPFVGFDLIGIEDKHQCPDENSAWWQEYIEVVGNVFDGVKE